jgi:hypothetical protein
MSKKVFTAAALTLAAAAAMATVTFDAASGTGFVGKGDVQLAFGWNNAALQANAGGLTFSYDAVETYDAECYWETQTGKGKVVVHDITVPRHTAIKGAVAHEARTHKQIDGFKLTGYAGAPVVNGVVPTIGAVCPGNNNGTVIAVTLVGSTSSLSVVYNGVSKPLQ